MKKSTKTGLGIGSLSLILGIQGLLTGLNQSRSNSCEVILDFPHISTYGLNQTNQKFLKINARTECAQAQNYSSISMTFYSEKSGRVQKLVTTRAQRQDANLKYPNKAFFKNFQLFCIGATPTRYLGEAKGFVQLANGKRVKVEGKSKISSDIECFVDAK